MFDRVRAVSHLHKILLVYCCGFYWRICFNILEATQLKGESPAAPDMESYLQKNTAHHVDKHKYYSKNRTYVEEKVVLCWQIVKDSTGTLKLNKMYFMGTSLFCLTCYLWYFYSVMVAHTKGKLGRFWVRCVPDFRLVRTEYWPKLSCSVRGLQTLLDVNVRNPQ